MIAVVGARVFDAVDGSAAERTVTVHNGLISAVDGPVPPDTTVIDGSGATLLPGLIDCHVHLCATASSDIIAQVTGDSLPRATLHAVRNAQAHLAAGVTTVRDCGALGGIAIEVGRAIEDGLVDGARVQAAGLVITITGGHGYFLGREVDGVDEVRKATRQAVKEGARFIKVMSTGGLLTPGVTAGRTAFAPPELAVLVEEAHNAGLRVATHAIGNEGIKNALRAGVDSVEHGFYLDDEAIELLCRREDVFLVPTLRGVECALRPRRRAGAVAARQVRGGGRRPRGQLPPRVRRPGYGSPPVPTPVPRSTTTAGCRTRSPRWSTSDCHRPAR